MPPAAGGDDPREPDHDTALSTQRRRWLSAAAMAAVLPVWPSGAARAAEPTKSEATPGPASASSTLMSRLFAEETISNASLSADGRYLAMIGDSRGRPVALIQDLVTQQTQVLMDSYLGLRAYRDVIALRWVLPDMVVMVLGRGTSLAFNPAGKLVMRMNGLYVGRLPDGDQGEPRGLLVAAEAMHVVDLRDGRWYVRPHDLPEEAIVHTALDAEGRLRAATTLDASRWSGKTVWSQWYRGPGPKAPWRQLSQSQGGEIWQPLRVLPDGQMAILARAGRDTTAVFRYDPETRQIGELMAGHETDDIVASHGEDAAVFDFVVTDGLRSKTYWFDERWSRLQKAVDQVLPNSVNVLSGEDPAGHVLVFSYSDVDPGRWHALDTQAKRIKEVAVSMPDVDPASLRPMEAYRYPARDGLSVPAYLTRPAAQGPAPTIVLIHGGPWARDHWGWDAEVQLLAAQGYAVFQPQFRGSTGFGLAYEQAGYRQWGESMQDDITDGVQQLIDRGIADPARLAIFGASYGGYAAMWGLVKTPKLYRCGISFAGISDLDDFVRTSWWDDSTAASRRSRRRLIGDPSTAQAQLRAVSPIRHVDRIEVPLLIVHGTEDKRVLPGQSERMVDAMKERGKRVEWLSLETGHGFDAPDSPLRIKYFRRVLGFLEEHLAPRASV